MTYFLLAWPFIIVGAIFLGSHIMSVFIRDWH